MDLAHNSKAGSVTLTDVQADLQVFESLRAGMFQHAYRMLGEVSAAEDVVQEAWLRWRARSDRTIRAPEAFLRTTVTRLALDALRRAKARRESYVGPWLPEPLIAPEADDPPQDDLPALNLAFLALLERLSPHERAAFLLHDILSTPYGEVAAILGRTEMACRKLVSRARVRVREETARFPADAGRGRLLLDAFLAAQASGDREAMARLLAADCVLVTDGGAVGRAALRPLVGASDVVRVLCAVSRKAQAFTAAAPARINGAPGYVFFAGDDIDTVIAAEGRGDAIAWLFVWRNPDKLAAAPVAEAARALRALR